MNCTRGADMVVGERDASPAFPLSMALLASMPAAILWGVAIVCVVSLRDHAGLTFPLLTTLTAVLFALHSGLLAYYVWSKDGFSVYFVGYAAIVTAAMVFAYGLLRIISPVTGTIMAPYSPGLFP